MTIIRVHTWQEVEADMVELGLYVHPEILHADDVRAEGVQFSTLTHECGRAIATFANRDAAITAASRLTQYRLDWRKMTEQEARDALLNFPGGTEALFAGLPLR